MTNQTPMTRALTEHGHDACGAEARSGNPCGRPAGWGTPHVGVGACKLHGGCTPSHVAAGARVLAERDAARSIADLGYELVADPLDALATLASKAVALSEHFADRVAELDEYRYESDIHTEQLRAELVLLERFMLMAQKFLTEWVRLGFEDRRVRVDEVRAALVAAVVEGVLRDLGHDPQAVSVLGVLDRWFPVLDGAPAPRVMPVGEAP